MKREAGGSVDGHCVAGQALAGLLCPGLVLLDLHGHLALDAGDAAEGGSHVPTGGALHCACQM